GEKSSSGPPHRYTAAAAGNPDRVYEHMFSRMCLNVNSNQNKRPAGEVSAQAPRFATTSVCNFFTDLPDTVDSSLGRDFQRARSMSPARADIGASLPSFILLYAPEFSGAFDRRMSFLRRRHLDRWVFARAAGDPCFAHVHEKGSRHRFTDRGTHPP